MRVTMKLPVLQWVISGNALVSVRALTASTHRQALNCCCGLELYQDGSAVQIRLAVHRK